MVLFFYKVILLGAFVICHYLYISISIQVVSWWSVSSILLSKTMAGQFSSGLYFPVEEKKIGIYLGNNTYQEF